MSLENQNTEQPLDPLTEATEFLLYGDPETAATKLRTAIHAESEKAHQVRQRRERLVAEHTRSMASLAKFNNNNDSFSDDPVIQGAGEAAMAIEQLRDLEGAGFDRKKAEESMGRQLKREDVFNLHLQMRADGARGMRSTDDLLKHIGETLEEKFGVRMRRVNEEDNRRHAIKERINATRALRGLPPEDRGDEAPRARSGDEPVTAETLKRDVRKGFGMEADPAVDDAITASRRKGFDTIASGRYVNKGADPANIRLNRSSEDRRAAFGR
jgi:hypothetical protein